MSGAVNVYRQLSHTQAHPATARKMAWVPADTAMRQDDGAHLTPEGNNLLRDTQLKAWGLDT